MCHCRLGSATVYANRQDRLSYSRRQPAFTLERDWLALVTISRMSKLTRSIIHPRLTLNLTTGAAFALLGAMPMVMITGQKGVLSRKQGRFQVVDIVATMAPLTKMARQIVSPTTIPTTVREAFRLAQQERPGPVHLELPEDIAAVHGARSRTIGSAMSGAAGAGR